MDVSQVRTDLIAEHDELDGLLAQLDQASWSHSTASPGWTVADQISHLAYFDEMATLAITEPELFVTKRDEFVEKAFAAPDAMDDLTLGADPKLDPPDLLAAWREHRAELAEASTTLSNDDRVEWFGPSMGSKSFLTARLMETWAHGQDIVDALGLEREPTQRLSHIARLGAITRGWSFVNRGLEAPTTPVRVSLTAPDGQRWEVGDQDAADSVEGSAVDFCLVTTQRRHLDDTDLVVKGEAAREWLEIAQTFAGLPTDGPAASGSSKL